MSLSKEQLIQNINNQLATRAAIKNDTSQNKVVGNLLLQIVEWASTSSSSFSGISGYSGYSGKSGFSGYSGLNGTASASGTSGYSGYSGTNGTSGYSGFSGYSGTNGTNGTSGFSGYSGSNGSNGASGTSGYSGYSGISGYSGANGSAFSAVVNKTASYTFAVGDEDKIFEGDHATVGVVFTLPSNATAAIPINKTLTVYKKGAAAVSFAQGSGATVISADSALGLRVTNSIATATKVATNTWLVGGDLQ